MAVYTYDLRGVIGDLRPEETLGDKWTDSLPKTARFGVHTILSYGFIRGAAPQAVLTGDSIIGKIPIPTSEIWELFSIGIQITTAGNATFNEVGASLIAPPRAAWGPTNPRWVDIPGDSWGRSLMITRPKNFVATTSIYSVDEASDVTPGSGLRRRILYSGSGLKISAEVALNASVTTWQLDVDCVRYPSSRRLLEMLDLGEVTERELFASLALRFPSPPEAS